MNLNTIIELPLINLICGIFVAFTGGFLLSEVIRKILT